MIFKKKIVVFEYSDNCLQRFFTRQSSIIRLFAPATYPPLHTRTAFARPALLGDGLDGAAERLPMMSAA